MVLPDEEQPLLQESPKVTWCPPPGFIWIQLGTSIRLTSRAHAYDVSVAIMSNVFLGGFDGTITASTYAVISSEFNAANTASWLTTSYLVTSTAFQPLYGRFSDLLGRRACFFTATITFMVGCLGCALATDVIFLNIMRALTGVGGGGLMTMGEFRSNKTYKSLPRALTHDSNDYQLRSDSFSSTRHVPGGPECLVRFWCNLWGFVRRHYC